jgi:hypothetical protein
MWNERKMPERWYGLLRERMQVEEQRMRVIKDGDIIEHDDLEELMAQAASLDREMLLVMRQAIAGALVREAARGRRPAASHHPAPLKNWTPALWSATTNFNAVISRGQSRLVGAKPVQYRPWQSSWVRQGVCRESEWGKD